MARVLLRVRSVILALVSIYASESVMSSINLTAFRAHKTIQTFITSINISLEIFAIPPHLAIFPVQTE
jgi:hypothetical protein